MIDSVFASILKNCQSNLRAVVSLGVLNGIPIPALSASSFLRKSCRVRVRRRCGEVVSEDEVEVW